MTTPPAPRRPISPSTRRNAGSKPSGPTATRTGSSPSARACASTSEHRVPCTAIRAVAASYSANE